MWLVFTYILLESSGYFYNLLYIIIYIYIFINIYIYSLYIYDDSSGCRMSWVSWVSWVSSELRCDLAREQSITGTTFRDLKSQAHGARWCLIQFFWLFWPEGWEKGNVGYKKAMSHVQEKYTHTYIYIYVIICVYTYIYIYITKLLIRVISP